ncbi:unnamed protein product [Lactuca saligna]|uniref:Uncharacterized protein n=1 Tax=Lactuca saligna TaxID=75948 RepID=A0AA35UVU7_LACSI|nr:unnamed protein product [Lactuca saligna]
MALFFGLLKEASNYLQLIIRDIVDVTASNPSICSIVDRFTVTTLVQEQWTNSLLAYPHFLCCFKLDPCAIENASSAASNPTFSRNPFHLTFTASSRCSSFCEAKTSDLQIWDGSPGRRFCLLMLEDMHLIPIMDFWWNTD